MIKSSRCRLLLLALVLWQGPAAAQSSPACLDDAACICTITTSNGQVEIQGQDGFIGATRWQVGPTPPAASELHLFVDAIALFQLLDATNDPTSADPIPLELTDLDPATVTFHFENLDLLDPSVAVDVSFALVENVQGQEVVSKLTQTINVVSMHSVAFDVRLYAHQDYDLDGTLEDGSVTHVPAVDPDPEAIVQDEDAAMMTTSVEVAVTDVSATLGTPPDTNFEVSLDGVLGNEILRPGSSGFAPELDNLPPPSGPADFEFAYSWQSQLLVNQGITVELTKTLTTALPAAGPGFVGIDCPEPGSGALASAALATLAVLSRRQRRAFGIYSR